ncbi:hypothetical protein [Paenibacillus gansuensis]|uniref:Uncharacterized protein n=1 Tax=Paenibacillus gansuensis TaxID=306542 RepID=A0ABW5PAR6_9BACL
MKLGLKGRLVTAWDRFWRREERKAGFTRPQVEALVDLHAALLIRLDEVQKDFPDIAMPAARLLSQGTDWEWFPYTVSNLPGDIQASIQTDLARYPENYVVISDSTEGTREEVRIYTLLSPGLRNKRSKAAEVKAKISIHPGRNPEQVNRFLDDLTDI